MSIGETTWERHDRELTKINVTLEDTKETVNDNRKRIQKNSNRTSESEKYINGVSDSTLKNLRGRLKLVVLGMLVFRILMLTLQAVSYDRTRIWFITTGIVFLQVGLQLYASYEFRRGKHRKEDFEYLESDIPLIQKNSTLRVLDLLIGIGSLSTAIITLVKRPDIKNKLQEEFSLIKGFYEMRKISINSMFVVVALYFTLYFAYDLRYGKIDLRTTSRNTTFLESMIAQGIAQQ